MSSNVIIVITGFVIYTPYIFSGVLCFRTLLEWVWYLTQYTSQTNLFTITDCKFSFFAAYFFTQYSSLILVMMSVEKCIVVYFPLKVRDICTVKTAKWACLVAAIIIAAYNIQWFFLMEAIGFGCYYTSTTSTSYQLILNQIDSVIYSFGPFAIMGFTNIAIIYKFIQAKIAVKRGTESTNQALGKSAMRGTAILITVSLSFY